MDSTQPHWVYVIRNTQGQHYIGVSIDPEHRLVQHNTGESKWTRNHLPWKLVWNQEYPLYRRHARSNPSSNAKKEVKDSTILPAFRRSSPVARQAHNPATAGSQVQILSPQPIFFDYRPFLPQKLPDSQKLSHRIADSGQFWSRCVLLCPNGAA